MIRYDKIYDRNEVMLYDMIRYEVMLYDMRYEVMLFDTI